MDGIKHDAEGLIARIHHDDVRPTVSIEVRHGRLAQLSGVYLDSITGIWAPQQRDALVFLNARYHYEDNGQFISSTGLGFRKLLPGHYVIFGVLVERSHRIQTTASGDRLPRDPDDHFFRHPSLWWCH